MANSEHVEIAKQGHAVIAAWREAHPELRLDLSRANLREANLSEANLSEANLSEANLIGADLSGADLSQAELSEVDLSGADLSQAELSEVDLSGADLSEADLSEADLSGADLSEADLSQADLSQANLIGADLSRANLSEANLSEANLNEANLSEANLNEADLSDADLSDANLSEANLNEANLNEANLIGADLSGADLSGAVLTGADLSGAKLSGANLSGANLIFSAFWMTALDGVDFRGAILEGTTISRVDLSAALHLETCRHGGPSSIGHDTLEWSRGRIPEAFLRGCGVSDVMIAYLPSLIGEMQPIQYYSCFISYSHRDEDFAQRLHGRMQQEHLRVWYAPEDMKGGRKTYHQIDEAIRIHDKLLLVLSPESMRSEWVQTEIRRAMKAEKEQERQKLFPIRLCSMSQLREWECFDSDSGRDLAVEVREYHIPDFTEWKTHDAFEAEFGKLLADLRTSEE